MSDAPVLGDNPPLSALLLDKHNKLNSQPIKLLRFLAMAHNKVIADARLVELLLNITEVINLTALAVSNTKMLYQC